MDLEPDTCITLPVVSGVHDGAVCPILSWTCRLLLLLKSVIL